MPEVVFNCEAFLEGLKSRKGKVIEAVRQKST